MIYVITDKEVKTYNSLKEIQEDDMIIDENELYSVGKDYVVKLSNRDLDFVRDKYNLSRVALDKLYVKSKNGKKLVYLAFYLTAGLVLSLFVNIFFIGALFF